MAPPAVRGVTLVEPGKLELRSYPFPRELEQGAVLPRMLASGICGTDKHTFLGETGQYTGTDNARSTPFPIIQGHENVGVVEDLGPGGALAFDGTPLRVGDRVVPAPNWACGACGYCLRGFPYYLCRNLKNYGNSLTSQFPPHLFGGWADYLYLLRGTPVFRVPHGLPLDVAVLTELLSVTHSLDVLAQMPRPGGFRPGDTVAVLGVGPLGVVHVAKAHLMGAGRVIAVDLHAFRLDLASDLGATDCVIATDGGAETIARIRALGCEIDVAIDASGFPETFLASTEIVRDGGTVLEVGAFVEMGSVAFDPAVLCGRSLTFLGVGGEDARAYAASIAILDRHHAHLPFARLVTHRFPLGKADDAMRTALEGTNAMKVVLQP